MEEKKESYKFIIMDLSKVQEKKIPEMKLYEIWIGNCHLGQGDHRSTEPEKVGEEVAVNFKTACIKMELKKKLQRIEEGERKGNLNNQDYPWWFNENTISDSWWGKFYETKEEAQKSFK